MAPDISSLTPSPRTTTTSSPTQQSQQQPRPSNSRRTSRIINAGTNTPPLPLGSPGLMGPPSAGLHGSGTSAFPPFSSSSRDEQGIPLRHPQPMTAVDMHKEFEAEQEAIVNRLTRELSALRAHSASVASSTSSISTSALEPLDPTVAPPTSGLVGPTHPTPSRRHRSSSSVSRGSVSHPFSSASSYAASVPSQQRRPSVTASRDERPEIRSRASNASLLGGRGESVSGVDRVQEAVLHRHELEEAKRENEVLRRRVKELERMVREKKESVPSAAESGANAGGEAT